MARVLLLLATSVALIAPTSASAAFKQVDRFGQELDPYGVPIYTYHSQDLAIDKVDGSVYFIRGHKIDKYSGNGVLTGRYGFADAQGIDVGASGSVYVTGGSGQVAELTNSLGLIRSWTRGSAAALLTRSEREVAIAVSESQDALYLASEHAVERYSLSEVPNMFTNRKAAIGSLVPNGAGSFFESVRAVEVDSSGRVYVLDGTGIANRVYRFSPTGQLQSSFSVPGNGVAHGLTIASNGSVFVSLFDDTAHSTTCVVELSPSGNQLTAFGGRVGPDGWFSQAFGLAAAPNGDLFVGSAFEIVKFSESGGGLTPQPCTEGGL
jgi:hypothetical protein